LKANDAILADPEKHMGLYEDLLQNYKAVQIAGGAAQNTARGAAYILEPKSVVYIGCIGKDKYGETLEKISADAGVKSEYLYDEKTPTGRCGVVITGHNRSMCTDLAAANNYKLEHLKEERIWKQVENAKVFYVGGFHLTVCVPAIKALAEEAAAKDKVRTASDCVRQILEADLCSNSSSTFPPHSSRNSSRTLSMRSCPMSISSSATRPKPPPFAESHNIESKDVKEIAKQIANMPKKNSKRARTVIFTQGTDPTIAVSAKDGGDVDVKEVSVHAISEDKINDTNGAGDAFAGGFVAGIVQGKSLDKAIDMGQWLAKLSIQELGPSYPQPKQTYSS
jgi:adenosine kinase